MELMGSGGPWALSLPLLLFAIGLFLLFWWRTEASPQRPLPPGPRPLPLLGNLLQLRTANILDCLTKLQDTYGPVYTLYLGSQKVVMLCGFQAVKEALIDHGDHFTGRTEIPITKRTVKGQGIFFSEGELWKQVRRFSLTTLRNFGMGKRSIEERIQEEIQFLVEELRKTKELPFDPTFFIRRSVSNVICSIVFGQRFDYNDKKFQILLDLIAENLQRVDNFWVQVYNLIPTILDRFPGPHQQLFENYRAQMRFVEEIMVEHQASLDPSSPRDYIDAFLIKIQQEKADPSSIFYPENLLISSLDLFFGGSESTSTTLRYGLLLLLKHPEVEEQVHEEIERVTGRNRRPCMEDRSKMPYTDAVIHEIQRFIDIFTLGVPRSAIVDTNFRGYTIPKGTIVMPFLNTVLNDPEHFEYTGTFNPRNFLEDDGSFKKNEAFMPFSIGKRMCIGEGLARMELFLFFTTILQNFKLQSTVDRKDLDITPTLKLLGKLPPPYEISLLPRL
ncbi:cytochrome P450 2H2-like [Ambystoma mexicanum]|uniref:cytochrome P450 2H2-like n=1 Tax=Ambystoma mexicanum TaxID=8296 RepID=UPI0037E94A05